MSTIFVFKRNYDESLKFYRDIYGFELIKEFPYFHKRYYNSWLKLGEFYIELQTGKEGENLNNLNPNTQEVIHFCLWVDDLVKEVQTIKQLGNNFILKNGVEIYQVESG